MFDRIGRSLFKRPGKKIKRVVAGVKESNQRHADFRSFIPKKSYSDSIIYSAAI
jgi:hypothetical protein